MPFHGGALDCVLIALSAFGLSLSVYLAGMFVRVQRGEAVRCVDSSCPMVMKTPYARTLGFPNFYLALPFYGGLLIFAVLRLLGIAAWLFVPAAIASGVALAMSAYLAHSLLVKLKQP